MWLSLKIAWPYRIETPIPANAFFEHLPKILEPTYTPVIGRYEFRADLPAFLEAEEASEEELYSPRRHVRSQPG